MKMSVSCVLTTVGSSSFSSTRLEFLSYDLIRAFHRGKKTTEKLVIAQHLKMYGRRNDIERCSKGRKWFYSCTLSALLGMRCNQGPNQRSNQSTQNLPVVDMFNQYLTFIIVALLVCLEAGTKQSTRLFSDLA